MSNSPSTVTAIAYAAHRCGDTELKREAVRRLREEYGIHVRFPRQSTQQKREVAT